MFDESGTSGDYFAKVSSFLYICKGLLTYITFLDYQKNHLFYGLDILPEVILDKINEL